MTGFLVLWHALQGGRLPPREQARDHGQLDVRTVEAAGPGVVRIVQIVRVAALECTGRDARDGRPAGMLSLRRPGKTHERAAHGSQNVGEAGSIDRGRRVGGDMLVRVVLTWGCRRGGPTRRQAQRDRQHGFRAIPTLRTLPMVRRCPFARVAGAPGTLPILVHRRPPGGLVRGDEAVALCVVGPDEIATRSELDQGNRHGWVLSTWLAGVGGPSLQCRKILSLAASYRVVFRPLPSWILKESRQNC
ncbi:MAG: hypothetical protein CMJ18_04210 [Phycisphaeraceae bacterium]|nr:hypothetical protein [Phycisphaeraceae bacterium]